MPATLVTEYGVPDKLHTPVFCPVIAEGVPGVEPPIVTFVEFEGPAPQVFDAETVIVPPAVPLVTVIELVDDDPDQPDGNDQL